MDHARSNPPRLTRGPERCSRMSVGQPNRTVRYWSNIDQLTIAGAKYRVARGGATATTGGRAGLNPVNPGPKGLLGSPRVGTIHSLWDRSEVGRRFKHFWSISQQLWTKTLGIMVLLPCLTRARGRRIDGVCGTGDYPLPDLPRGARSRSATTKVLIWTRWHLVPVKNVNHPRAPRNPADLVGPHTTPPIVNYKYMTSTCKRVLWAADARDVNICIWRLAQVGR